MTEKSLKGLVPRKKGARTGPGVPSRKFAEVKNLGVPALLSWFRLNRRSFPWRRTRSAYHILVAEFLLRRTQANQVVRVYEEIIRIYPDISSLARANPNRLRRIIAPLGLRSRADHLLAAARELKSRHSCSIPPNYSALTSLPGIGRYAAHAILSLAYHQNLPMVDEGVARILRRVFGISESKPATCDPEVWELASTLIPRHLEQSYNLALLDLAALVCKPTNPRCGECPLSVYCSFGHKSRAHRG